MSIRVAGCDKSRALSVGCPTKMYKIEQYHKKRIHEGRARRGRSTGVKIRSLVAGSGVFDNDNAAFACCILPGVLD